MAKAKSANAATLVLASIFGVVVENASNEEIQKLLDNNSNRLLLPNHISYHCNNADWTGQTFLHRNFAFKKHAQALAARLDDRPGIFCGSADS